MKQKTINFAILYFFLCFAGLSFSKEIKRQFDSTKFLGRGNAGLAKTDAQESLFYNPSRINHASSIQELSLLSPQINVSDDALSLHDKTRQFTNMKIKNESLLSKLNHKDIYLSGQNLTGMLLDQSALGFLSKIQSQLAIDINAKSPVESSLLVEAVAYNGAFFGLSREVLPNLHVGILAKALKKNEIYLEKNIHEIVIKILEDDKENFDKFLKAASGFGLGLDSGVTFEKNIGNFLSSYSLVIQNMGDFKFYGQTKPRSDLQLVNAGTAFSTLVEQQNFYFAFDLLDIEGKYNKDFFNRFNMGLQWDYRNYIGLVSGINQGYVCYGFFTRYKILELMFSRYAIELGEKVGDKENFRNSIKVQLGWFF